MAHEIRLAVIGAGMMAGKRASAFSKDPRTKICGVAAKRQTTAEKLAAALHCDFRTSDYRDLLQAKPNALLIEVPHEVQDEMVDWALAHDLPVLVGGPISTSLQGVERIAEIAAARNLIVEAGYEARYKSCWEAARDRITAGEIGQLIAVQSRALWNGDPQSWYYSQARSQGMPLTHISYAFLNPLRWIMGDPLQISAFANTKKHQTPQSVREETCAANMAFPGNVLLSMVAGYVSHGEPESWTVFFLGTDGCIQLYPTEMDNGWLKLYRHGESSTLDFTHARDAFEIQAETFLNALEGENRLRNQPQACVGDLRAVEAIVASIRENRTIALQR
ncbi:MAG TPA: Gfo/Idh/MocA family oxidoreductase [Candidatus Angelobacter sp.]|nr:Gfo/Idh/MocA family oxidoreductase [Candidatus Angelobacter sp.]